MKILAIETSCDETAIAILEAEGGFTNPKFKLIANNLLSQIEIHKEYGGVFPSLAKREHSKNLVPILEKTLQEANLLKERSLDFDEKRVKEILEREPELLKMFLNLIPKIGKPDIEYIAVTVGPGLEPALWVGINFAKALSLVWNIPLIGVNHMEGHILSPLMSGEKIEFPALALLISGGHTELVLMKDWLSYEIVGETQDDAVGEAFDKVARMMGLPYPGGPEIGRIAKNKRINPVEDVFNLPRPMIDSPNCHFSFSGLKTAVLYKIKDLDLDENLKAQMAKEFEDTVVEILIKKTKKALREYGAETLIIGGGVIANTELRYAFQEFAQKESLKLLIPEMKLTTDNAIMIAIAGYFRALEKPEGVLLEEVRADGNLVLTSK